MPIIEVTCSDRVVPESRRALAERLPHLVSVAVACEAEQYDGNLKPGDVILRFHEAGPWDSQGVDVLIEVKSKWFEDRARNRQERVDVILHGIRDVAADEILIGVYFTMPMAAWAQSNEIEC